MITGQVSDNLIKEGLQKVDAIFHPFTLTSNQVNLLKDFHNIYLKNDKNILWTGRSLNGNKVT